MKFALAKEHRDFFHKEGMIEFEEFFTLDQIHQLNQAIDSALAKRSHINESQDQQFFKGRDLWRETKELEKLTCQPRLAQLVNDLTEKKPLRLAYDQLLPAFSSQLGQGLANQKYSAFLNQIVSLDEISSLTGIICGILIALSPSTKAEEVNPSNEEEKTEKTEDKPKDIFPSQPGNITIFSGQNPFSLNQLFNHPDQRYYLIVYSLASTVYQVKEKDPQPYALKQYGYDIHDHLNDRFHPIVYR